MPTGFERVTDQTLRQLLKACGDVARETRDASTLGSISAIVIKIHEELRDRHGVECYCSICLPMPIAVWA